jgi:predicted nuclease of predicted toxin-antitoxin system
VRLLLDEHLSTRVAALLRGRGHDAVAMAERPDLIGRSDSELWNVARQEPRALVTQDLRDFLPLAAAASVEVDAPTTLVLVSVRAFPRSLDGTGRLVAALAALADACPDDESGAPVVWLEPTP